MFEYAASMFGLSQNCWFCNKYSFVSPLSRNAWTCSHCDQYNGFDENGDYNKVIPEMYKSISTKNSSSSNKSACYSSEAFKNEMCFKCNLNQQKKIKQLSQFEPTSEKTFDLEYAVYKDTLEKLFDLCETCKPRTRFALAAQNGRLKHYLLNQGEIKFLYERPCQSSSFRSSPATTPTSTRTPPHRATASPKMNDKKSSMGVRVLNFLCYFTVLLSVSVWLTVNIDSVNDQFQVVRNLSTPVIHSFGRALNDTKTYDRYIFYWHEYSKLPYCILVYVFSISALLFANPITKPHRLIKVHWLVWGASLAWFVTRFVYNLRFRTFKRQEDYAAIIPDYDLLLIPIILGVNLVSYTNSVATETTPTPSTPRQTSTQSRIANKTSPPVFHGLRKPLFDATPPAFNPFCSALVKKRSTLDHSESEPDSDDDSSIVSGLTNLYLNRNRACSTTRTAVNYTNNSPSVYSNWNKTYIRGPSPQQPPPPAATTPKASGTTHASQSSWIAICIKFLLVQILLVILTLQFIF